MPTGAEYRYGCDVMPNVSSQPPLLVTTCKPFVGPDAIVQSNALESWRASGFEVLLLGDEQGSAETSARLGALHEPMVARGGGGLPLLRDVLAQGLAHARERRFAYVNADIILTPRSAGALEAAIRLSQATPMLACARRYTLPLDRAFDFRSDWRSGLTRDGIGGYDPDFAIDLFLFAGWVPQPVPDLVVGRAGWDNWLVQRALDEGVPIADLSFETPLFHPVQDVNPMRFNDFGFGGDAMLSPNARFTGGGAGLKQATHFLIADELADASDPRVQSRLRDIQFEPAETLRAFGATVPDWRDWPADQLRLRLLSGAVQSMLFAPPSLDVSALPKPDARLISAFREGQTAPVQDWILSMTLKQAAQERVQGRRLLIWGAGAAGRALFAAFRRANTPVEGFVESAPARDAVLVDQTTVPLLDGARACALLKQGEAVVFVATMFWPEIIQRMTAFGLNPKEEFWI